MQFNKKTAADIALENKVKQESTKLAKKAGKGAAKAAFKMTRRIWMIFVGIFGAPTMFIIFFVTILLFILPSMIFGGTVGVDNKYPDDKNNIQTSAGASIGDGWETAAEKELEKRYNQLSVTTFWDDLKDAFSGKGWNNSAKTFKTEYADADSLKEDGESISSGYFSVANRMVAIINQAFIVAKDDATTNKNIFWKSPAMKRAAKTATEMTEQQGTGSFYSTQRGKYPLVPDENITSVIEKKVNTEEDFVYQACYLIAASSTRNMLDDDPANSVRDVLDGAFKIVGLDNPGGDAQRICWTPVVIPREEYTETKVLIHAAGDPYDGDGDGIADEFYAEDVYETHYFLKLIYEYTVRLSADFQDMVNEHYEISDASGDNPPLISLQTQVDVSATELYKFYRDSPVNLGIIGLPLPEKSYTIGETFGCRCAVHNTAEGHGGQDLPAPNGTNVYSVADGEVTYVQKGRVQDTTATGKASYGNCVFITHADGIVTRYGHLQITTVNEGDIVKAGDPIGKVGNTGYSFGNHLHFEMLSGGKRIDPMNTDVGVLIRQHHR